MRLPAEVSVSVLVPNERGLERALPLRGRFHEINGFLSASETHNQKNVGRSVEESLAGLGAGVSAGPRRRPALRGGDLDLLRLSLRGSCPGRAGAGGGPPLAEAGAEEVGFGDTTGMANPLQVRDFFARARAELPGVELTAHFHNTRGQGLANVLAALEAGVDSFESSFGELGGCPVPAGATGNIATEDLVSMLEEMGVATGIDLARLLDASRAAQEALGRPLGSHVLTAGPVDWH